MTTGKKIKQLRKLNKLTLEQLAKKAGTCKSYIWELENSLKLDVSARILHGISKALNTTVENLLLANPRSVDEMVALINKITRCQGKYRRQNTVNCCDLWIDIEIIDYMQGVQYKVAIQDSSIYFYITKDFDKLMNLIKSLKDK
jgi:transcriptional regulator with XRE-family HTH domain